MVCPIDYKLCGTLTIESGLGAGNYHHNIPGVHGLWPEVNQYGNSSCVKPKNFTFDITSKSDLCNYVNDTDKNFWFPKHEWYKHGKCSGGPGPASEYFKEMCIISNPIVKKIMEYKGNWDNIKNNLKDSNWGEYIWDIDEKNKQLLFSVCSTGNGFWIFCPI